ncbi:MAG: formate C-acetyltransferase [Clostridiales bacterium]|nr:formate C-acetyltransferase [Clostridiales bacterium]
MSTWEGFKGTKWKKEINVEDFILHNFTQYNGDASFLAGSTERTQKVLAKLEKLLAKEQKNGVLGIDTKRAASINSHPAGYLDKKNEIIVGIQSDKPLVRLVSPFSGLNNVKNACKAYKYKLSDEVLKQFQYRTTHNDGVFRVYSPLMRKARHCGIITGLPDAYSRGRIIGDYRRVALYGVDYLITKKKEDKLNLYNDGINESNLMLIEDVQKQIEGLEALKAMAKRYGYDISRPAANAKEAVQWLYFGYLGAVKEQTGAANSLGRISTFLDIYFQKDLKKGRLTEVEAQEIIDDFVMKLRMVRHLRTPEYNEMFAGDPTWVTLSEGGVSNDGRHMVTKTSYRILNTLYTLKPSAEPNITILWSKYLPQNYKDFCAKVSIDTDSIQYENDDLMRERFGDDYGIACCVSAMQMGKQMQFFGARCNIAKMLLMALNGGYDEVKGDKVFDGLGDIFEEGLLDYDKVMKAYKKCSKMVAKLYVDTLNCIHYMHDRYAYERLMMSLHDTKVGRLMAFGVCGLSVLADSLSAIKYAKVYARKDERGLITHFDVEGDYPKYGNDDDRVDEIAKWIVENFYANIKANRCYRDATPTLSVLTITSNIAYGKKTGDTPDGRKKGEPFAPGANPMHGRDKNGALASLNSVCKLKYDTCRDGISNTFSIIPSALGAKMPERIKNLTGIIDGYFAKDAQHINVNVLNKEMLIDAMNNPKKYPNLTIRISGYAVNFNKLNKEQQTEIINRTFHEKM